MTALPACNTPVSKCASLTLLAAAFLSPGLSVAQADALQSWLSENAVPVRSLDAADEQFSDLEPLVKAIGAARVVQLGELSHGSGSHFAAKARLVKFLHQRMGFDVLLWESGLYSLTFVEAGLRSGADPVASAQQGIFPLWSTMEQVRPVFEYAQAVRGTRLPLEMGGFDIQFSAEHARERFAGQLRGFAAALAEPDARRLASALVEEALAGYAGFSQAGQAARPEQLKAFLHSAARLLALMQERRAVFAQAHGERSVDFMRQAIENFREQATSVYEMHAADGLAHEAVRNRRWNRRDAQNARTLRWLIDEYYRGRKILIWAHDSHVMNAYFSADWLSLSDKPQPGGMKPMGAFLKEWYGDRVYTIGMTGYAGEDKHLSRDEILTVAPAAQGSLEQRLHLLEKPYLFVDFRGAAHVANHPLRRPLAMRIASTEAADTMPDLTRVFDGVFYVDRLQPAVPIRPLPGTAPASPAPPAAP